LPFQFFFLNAAKQAGEPRLIFQQGN